MKIVSRLGTQSMTKYDNDLVNKKMLFLSAQGNYASQNNSSIYDALCQGGICHSGESKMSEPLYTVAIEISNTLMSNDLVFRNA